MRLWTVLVAFLTVALAQNAWGNFTPVVLYSVDWLAQEATFIARLRIDPDEIQTGPTEVELKLYIRECLKGELPDRITLVLPRAVYDDVCKGAGIVGDRIWAMERRDDGKFSLYEHRPIHESGLIDCEPVSPLPDCVLADASGVRFPGSVEVLCRAYKRALSRPKLKRDKAAFAISISNIFLVALVPADDEMLRYSEKLLNTPLDFNWYSAATIIHASEGKSKESLLKRLLTDTREPELNGSAFFEEWTEGKWQIRPRYPLRRFAAGELRRMGIDCDLPETGPATYQVIALRRDVVIRNAALIILFSTLAMWPWRRNRRNASRPVFRGLSGISLLVFYICVAMWMRSRSHIDEAGIYLGRLRHLEVASVADTLRVTLLNDFLPSSRLSVVDAPLDDQSLSDWCAPIEKNWDFHSVRPWVGYAAQDLDVKPSRANYVYVHWGVLAAVAAILPLMRIAIWIRFARRTRAHCCVQCGYDIRATPAQCPECGRRVIALEGEGVV